MKRKTLFNLPLVLGFLLALALSLISPQKAAASNSGAASITPLTADSHTLLLDHFDGNTQGTVYGSLQYTDSIPGLGQAPSFQAAGTYIKYPVGTSVGTIELWIKPAQYGSILVGQWEDTTSPPMEGYVVHFNISPEGKLGYGQWGGTGGLTGATTIPLNKWTHIAVSFGNYGKLYVNGVVDASTPDNCMPAWGPGNFLYLPYWGRAGLVVDELRVSNIQRSDAEILQDAQGGYDTATPTPTAASLVATTAASNIYPGDPFSVDLNIQNASNLYAAQATCTAAPAVIQPQSAVFGNFFDPVNRLIGANTADAAAGTWTGAISQRSPAPPLSGNGPFATISYTATAPGTASISCGVPLFSDRDGQAQNATSTGVNVTVLPFATISGIARYQGRPHHAGITLTATGLVTRTATTDDSGDYTVDHLKGGSYDIRAVAPRYLPNCTTSTVTSGQNATLPDTLLKGGDANDDGTINIGDATLVAANFGLHVPPANLRADINGDGVIDVRDLAILGGNYGLSGCQPW